MVLQSHYFQTLPRTSAQCHKLHSRQRLKHELWPLRAMDNGRAAYFERLQVCIMHTADHLNPAMGIAFPPPAVRVVRLSGAARIIAAVGVPGRLLRPLPATPPLTSEGFAVLLPSALSANAKPAINVIAAANQGLTLVHFSAQRNHLLRETLGSFSGSVKRNGSG